MKRECSLSRHCVDSASSSSDRLSVGWLHIRKDCMSPWWDTGALCLWLTTVRLKMNDSWHPQAERKNALKDVEGACSAIEHSHVNYIRLVVVLKSNWLLNCNLKATIKPQLN